MPCRDKRPCSLCALVIRCVAIIMLTILGGGCGRSTGPVVQFVEGAFFLDGEPLADASVGFSPEPGTPGLPAYARTDSRGMFRLTSTRGGRRDAGATVGEYIVTVSKVVGELVVEETDDPDIRKKRPRSKEPKNVVPDVYGEIETSPLRATIRKGANTGSAFVFQLKTPTAAAPRR